MEVEQQAEAGAQLGDKIHGPLTVDSPPPSSVQHLDNLVSSSVTSSSENSHQDEGESQPEELMDIDSNGGHEKAVVEVEAVKELEPMFVDEPVVEESPVTTTSSLPPASLPEEITETKAEVEPDDSITSPQSLQGE